MATASELDAQDRRFKAPPAGGWHVAWGVLLIIAGILAMAMPAVAALATGLLFAWLLVIGFWLLWAGVWRIVLRPASPA